MKRTAALAAATAMLSLATAAHAELIAAPVSGSTLEAMPASNQFSAGPIVFGNNVTWSSTDGTSVFGWTNSYGFNANGAWSGNPPMAGTNSDTAAMTFTLASDASSIGGTLNWACCSYSPVTMSVFDSGGVLLESFALSSGFANLVAANAFHGFSRSAGDIRSFTMTGGYVGLRDLSVDYAGLGGVPEPQAWALLILGFGIVGGSMRQRRRGGLRSLAAA